MREDVFGSINDGWREAGEAGYLDAVRLVSGAGEDLTEEDDVIVPFSDGDVVVLHGLFTS